MALQVGQTVQIERVFEQADFDRFARLSGDDNPIHVDAAFAARTRFGRTVAHGMLLYSAVSAVLGSRLPGPGMLPVEQDLMFPSPTYAGERVTIRVLVTGVEADGTTVELSTSITRPNGAVGLQGRTVGRLGNWESGKFENWEIGGVVERGSGEAGNPGLGLALGQRAEVQRVFGLEDLDAYVALTGDANPIFADDDYAQRRELEGRMLPGGLLGGLFSYLLGTRLPGRGTNYLKQRLVFPAPAYPGQPLTAGVKVVRLRPEKQLVNLRTVCSDDSGQVVCYGEALVLVRDVGGTV
jgi:acyl dehydratase